jgi:hypothetical protein
MTSDRPTHVPTRSNGEDLIASGEYAWCFEDGCGLPVGQWLSKFEVFAWMEFGGDMKSAEDHLRKVGYGGGQTPIVPPQTGCG